MTDMEIIAAANAFWENMLSEIKFVTIIDGGKLPSIEAVAKAVFQSLAEISDSTERSEVIYSLVLVVVAKMYEGAVA